MRHTLDMFDSDVLRREIAELEAQLDGHRLRMIRKGYDLDAVKLADSFGRLNVEWMKALLDANERIEKLGAITEAARPFAKSRHLPRSKKLRAAIAEWDDLLKDRDEARRAAA